MDLDGAMPGMRKVFVDVLAPSVAQQYIVCKPMDMHGYSGTQRVCLRGNIHAHGYLHRQATMRRKDMDLDIVYPSKPAPLPTLPGRASWSHRMAPLIGRHGLYDAGSCHKSRRQTDHG